VRFGEFVELGCGMASCGEFWQVQPIRVRANKPHPYLFAYFSRRKEMDLRIFEPRARAILGILGLRGKWEFRWLRQEGIVGWTDFQDRAILLSRAYVRNNTEPILLDLIYHLAAHALSDRENHGKEWKHEANELGVALDETSEYYQKLLQQEVIPKSWPTVEPRSELRIYRSCLAPLRRRHSTSVRVSRFVSR
jgi:hypothetical protein